MKFQFQQFNPLRLKKASGENMDTLCNLVKLAKKKFVKTAGRCQDYFSVKWFQWEMYLIGEQSEKKLKLCKKTQNIITVIFCSHVHNY